MKKHLDPPICSIPGCHEKITTKWYCSHLGKTKWIKHYFCADHVTQIMNLTEIIQKGNYSDKYQKLRVYLNLETTNERDKKDIRKALKNMAEYKIVQKEYKKLFCYADHSFIQTLWPDYTDRRKCFDRAKKR